MTDSTHNPKSPINSLIRDNTTDALTVVYCCLRFIHDYMFLTISRLDTPPHSANIGFSYMLNLIAEAVEYEIAKIDPDWDRESKDVAEVKQNATENAIKGD